MKVNKHKGKKFWPKDWLSETVASLVPKVWMLLLLLLPFCAMSQLTVNLGTGKSDLKKNFISLGVSYLMKADSLFGGQDNLVYGKNSFLLITPDINIEGGSEDAFSSITAKATALLATFKTKQGEILLPDLSRTVHTFPLSVGVETNSNFSFINAVAEAGWVPWYQLETSNTPAALRYSKFGLFLQGGYKFKLDSAGTQPIGGEVDESSEPLQSGLFRAKGTAEIDTKDLLKIQSLKLGLVASGDAWYDFVNKELYYRLRGIFRVFLSGGNSVDFIIQKGSGEPLFNNGVQRVARLTLTL